MKTTEIRKILRAEFGDRQYKITTEGEIHVFGKMPNTDEDGWYLLGFVGDAETEQRLQNL